MQICLISVIELISWSVWGLDMLKKKVHSEVPVLYLQGFFASPRPNVPYRTYGRHWGGTAEWQRSSQWRGSSCCLQLRTPQEEEELLFPWKHDHFLWSWSSSVWTVPARQSGKDTQRGHCTPGFEVYSWYLIFSILCCITYDNVMQKTKTKQEKKSDAW